MKLSAAARHRWCLAVHALALVIGTSCSPSAPPLRIGINAWPGYEFLYLAQEKGFYRDEGVDIRILEFSSLSDARRAYERGQIDGLGTTVIDVLQIRDHSNRAPQIVQVVDYSDGADMVLARPGITSSATLRGKRIGVELGSLGVYILARCLEKHQLAPSDITLVSADQMSMEKEFLKGDLDAIVTYPPTSVKLLNGGKAHQFFTSAEIPGEVLDVIAVKARLTKFRAPDISKLLRAFHRAVEYSARNPADAYAIMSAREGLTSEEFATALRAGTRLVSAAQQSDYLGSDGKLLNIIETADRILRQNGQIGRSHFDTNSFTAAFATIDDSNR